jgi:TFIIF-interacting CTD phosphatase-like protein
MTSSFLRGRVLLDLDQTLISAEPSEEYDFKKNREKAKKFVFHDMDGYYIVFERPGLQSFLSYLFDNFIVSIWTAATKDYALYVIDKIILIDPKRKIDYVFFDYHCDVSRNVKKGSKNLSMLWDIYKIPGYEETLTFILDDYDEVCSIQPRNCIRILPFQFDTIGSENDTFLSKLVKKLELLKSRINKKSDIRPVVRKINKTL